MTSHDTVATSRVVVPDDPSGAFTPRFPSAQMVSLAAGLLGRYRLPDRVECVGSGQRLTPSDRKSIELGFLDPRSVFLDHSGCSHRYDTYDDGRQTVEGPRSEVVVSPGSIQIRRRDYVRSDRSAERRAADRRRNADLAAQDILRNTARDAKRAPGSPGRGRVTCWSAKSRANMTRRLATLDYTPMFSSGHPPAMVTLTYPGRWQDVAPDSATAYGHLRKLAKRFRRAYGRELVGVWKREFQRRGAPHWHIFMIPPTDRVNGESFRAWLARNWTEVLNPSREPSESVGTAAALGPSEWDRTLNLHLGESVVSYSEGMRACDPRRLAVYFSKHGLYSAKDYQNEPPKQWVEAGAVGRYWGVWGLRPVEAVVEVTPERALASARTLRRWARQNGYTAQREVWRSRTLVHVDTGEVRVLWRRRKVRRRVRRMRGDAGFLVVNDAPAMVSQLARHLDQIRGPAS